MSTKRQHPGLSHLMRHAARVASGTGLGQLALLLVSPIISRLYTPDEFGVLAAFLSVLAVAVVVSSWRYQLAVVIPENDDDARDVVALGLVLVVVTAAFMLPLAGIFGPWVAARMGSPALAGYGWLLPFALLAAGWQSVLGMWSIRRKDFSALAMTKAVEGPGRGGAQVCLGLLHGIGARGLLIGDIVGRSAATLLLVVRLRGSLTGLRTHFTWQRLRSAASLHRRFSVFGVPGALLNAFGLQAPLLFFAAYYGMGVAGWFALAQRVVATPMTMIGQAVAQVYLGEAAELARTDPGRLAWLFRRTVLLLLLVGALPIGLLIGLGPVLFSWIFGPEWNEAGAYVRLGGFMFLVQFAVSPLSHTLNVLQRQSWQLAWDSGRFAVVVGVFVTANRLGASARSTVAAFAVSMSLCYVVHLLLSWLAISRLRRAREQAV